MGGYGWIFVEGRRWKSGQVETDGQEGEEPLDIYTIGSQRTCFGDSITVNKEPKKKREKKRRKRFRPGNKHCPVNVPVGVR